MASPEEGFGRQGDRRLQLTVAISVGFAARDTCLLARGGGTTPAWLLATETVAFTATALAGLATLRSATSDRATEGSLGRAWIWAIWMASFAHCLRVVIYVRKST